VIPPYNEEINRRRNRRGKLYIFHGYLLLGDTINIGEAALGICFPLKAFSSHPMHPVPHFSMILQPSIKSFAKRT